MKEVIEILKREAIKAINHNDLPISAVITFNDKIIAYGHNEIVKKNNPFLHAEIIVIKKACKILDTTHLNDCILYTSLIPCDFCKSAIDIVKIKKVYYILDNEKKCNKTIEFVKINNYNIENNFKLMLKRFFEKIRKK